MLASVVAWLGAGLLLTAGWAKLRRPSATTRVLHLVGLPESSTAVRVLGVVEVVVGVTALWFGGVANLALAGLYVAFTVFVARARRDDVSCGCFGTDDDVPVTRLHVTVDGIVAVAAAAAAVVGTGLGEVATAPHGWVVVGVVVVGIALARTLLVDVPVLADAMRRAEPEVST